MSAARKQRGAPRILNESTGSLDLSSNSILDVSRNSRVAEKESLQRLNTRLAEYIETVRRLENENGTLRQSIEVLEVTKKDREDDISARFQKEIERLRDLLNFRDDESTRRQIDVDTAIADAAEYKKRVEKLERELKLAQDDARYAHAEADDAKVKLARALKDLTAVTKTNQELEKEVADLRKQVAVLKKNLEDESALRSTLQAKLNSAIDDHKFQLGTLRSQLVQETEKRRYQKMEIERTKANEYEEKLAALLEDSRNKAAAELARNSEKIAHAYKAKLEDAVNDAKAAAVREQKTRVELMEYRSSSGSLSATVKELEKKLADLEKRIAQEQHLNNLLIQEKNRQKDEDDEKIRRLIEENGRLMTEIAELADAKILFDNEIRDYESLLDTEESRLSIGRSPTKTKTSTVKESHSVSRGAKRRRLVDEDDDTTDTFDMNTQREVVSNATGMLEILSVAENGDYVKLQNTSNDVVKLGGKKIYVNVGNRATEFKFNKKSTCQPNGTVTVWSARCGKKNTPPDFAMTSNDWPESNNEDIKAQLINEEGEEEAAWGFISSTYIAEGDPNERCSIM